MRKKCKYRIKTGGCKLEVCPDDELCDIETAEPYCPDYEELTPKKKEKR